MQVNKAFLYRDEAEQNLGELKLYVYTLRLIGPISYPGECDLMVQPQKYRVIFSRMHFVTFVRI